jgi:hypothetical protein
MQSEYQATKDELSNAAGTILNFDASPSADESPTEMASNDETPSENSPGDEEASV